MAERENVCVIGSEISGRAGWNWLISILEGAADRFSATASGFTPPFSICPSDDAKFINSITASYRMNIYLFSLLDQPNISVGEI